MKNVTRHPMKSKPQRLDVTILRQVVQNILFGIISLILKKMVKPQSIAYFVVSIIYAIKFVIISLKSDIEHQVLNIRHEMQPNVENI